MNEGMKEASVGEIQDLADSMRKDLDRQKELIATLVGRIKPALRERNPNMTDSEKQVEQSKQTPLGLDLNQLKVAIISTNRTLDDLIERVEL